MPPPPTRVAPSSVARAWSKAFAANYTGSFPTTDPDRVAAESGGRPTPASGECLIDFGSGIVPSEIHLVLFGAGSNDQTVKGRLWGFRACTGGFEGTLLWAGTGTLSQSTGTDGFDVVSTDRRSDAITTTVGTESVTCRTTSPGSDLPAEVVVRTMGCEFLILAGDKDAATSVNFLYAGE